MGNPAVKIRGASEGSGTSAQEYVFDEANQIQLGPVMFGHYLKSYFEKEVKMTFTKLDQADLDFLAESFPIMVSELS